MFKVHLVARRPSGIDGFLSDEAMAAALRVLVDLVHPALVDAVLLVVMVRNDAVVGSTAVVVVDHPVNMDGVAHF